jgi:hypothetical protein
MSIGTDRLSWQTAGLLALVAGLAPATARAGCGDGQVPLHVPPTVHHPAPRPLPPCSGPTCSRLPLVPPAVPPIVVPPGNDPAALADDISLPICRPSRRLDDEPSRRPVRQANSIFHPPR